jgi:hypothetical protein
MIARQMEGDSIHIAAQGPPALQVVDACLKLRTDTLCPVWAVLSLWLCQATPGRCYRTESLSSILAVHFMALSNYKGSHMS